MKILNLIQCANLGGMEQASLRPMSLGVPVVASVVGLKEARSSSEWGMIFNRHEPETLAEAAVRKLSLVGRTHVGDVSNPEKLLSVKKS